LFKDIEACDAGATGSWRHEASQDPHGRSLPGAVRAEESHDLPSGNLEIQILNGSLTSVTFRQVLNLNHGATLR
jgi:hypothetical protein